MEKPTNMTGAEDRHERQVEAEMAADELERLQTVLYQALDEWLRVYVANQMKNISAQPKDVQAVDRALHGANDAIKRWRRGRALVQAMDTKSSELA